MWRYYSMRLLYSVAEDNWQYPFMTILLGGIIK